MTSEDQQRLAALEEFVTDMFYLDNFFGQNEVKFRFIEDTNVEQFMAPEHKEYLIKLVSGK